MMPISNSICQYVWKDAMLNKNICHFLGPSPSALSGKKFQNMGTYTKWCNAALWSFFPQNALGDGPAFWIFFPWFTDKGSASFRKLSWARYFFSSECDLNNSFSISSQMETIFDFCSSDGLNLSRFKISFSRRSRIIWRLVRKVGNADGHSFRVIIRRFYGFNINTKI